MQCMYCVLHRYYLYKYALNMIVHVFYFIVFFLHMYDVFVIHVYIIYIDYSILYVLQIRIMVGFRYPLYAYIHTTRQNGNLYKKST